MSTLPRMASPAGRSLKWPQTLRLFVPLILAQCFVVHNASAGVSLYDQLATPERPFFLKLRTHRGPLALGGVRGSLWIDERKIGDVLTGVDGYGFLKYKAPATGTFSLTVRTPAGDAEARVRIIAPSVPVVLLEAETLIWQMRVMDRGSSVAGVLARIAADFELAYLCGPTSRPAMRALISSRGLPDAIVLVGNNRKQFERLVKRGVQIFAVVGSARFIASARGFGKLRFSFEKKAQAHHITRWEDLVNQLEPEGKTP